MCDENVQNERKLHRIWSRWDWQSRCTHAQASDAADRTDDCVYASRKRTCYTHNVTHMHTPTGTSTVTHDHKCTHSHSQHRGDSRGHMLHQFQTLSHMRKRVPNSGHAIQVPSGAFLFIAVHARPTTEHTHTHTHAHTHKPFPGTVANASLTVRKLRREVHTIVRTVVCSCSRACTHCCSHDLAKQFTFSYTSTTHHHCWLACTTNASPSRARPSSELG